MHCVYFARHGETVWNVENKICGMTDSPLTEKGRAQARELGEKLRASGLRIDEILYSPDVYKRQGILCTASAAGASGTGKQKGPDDGRAHGPCRRTDCRKGTDQAGRCPASVSHFHAGTRPEGLQRALRLRLSDICHLFQK